MKSEKEIYQASTEESTLTVLESLVMHLELDKKSLLIRLKAILNLLKHTLYITLQDVSNRSENSHQPTCFR